MKANAWRKFVAAGVPAFIFAWSVLASPGPIVITLDGDKDAKADAVITVDGLPYVAGTEIHDVRPAGPENAISYTFAGDGRALLTGVPFIHGLMLFVR